MEQVIRIAAAVVCGGLIGLEREFGDKPAGFRTIILICVGACVFTIMSEAAGGHEWDRGRIAAQIVSGIGFLGAGAILRHRTNVVGLTTAATIWAVAAIGMAAGFGNLRLAGLGTVAILVVLWLFDVVEKRIGEIRDLQQYEIAAPVADDVLIRIEAMFSKAGLRTRKRRFFRDGTSVVFQVWAMGHKDDHDRLRTLLIRSDEYELRRS